VSEIDPNIPVLDVDVDPPSDNVLLKITQAGYPMAVPMAAQTAFDLGEKLARAAHALKFPHDRIEDGSYIAQQVRARATDKIRDDAIVRLTRHIQNDLALNTKSPGKRAVEYVDVVLHMFGVK